jgi:uncharacterized protein (TIGR00369 family)
MHSDVMKAVGESPESTLVWESARAMLSPMKELPHTRSCFVCGETNPAGFNLRSYTDGRIVRVEFTFGADHVGFRNTVHGGLTATLLDEIMTWACVVQSGRFAYCAELNVRYLHPVQPGQPIIALAEMMLNRRGRLFEAKAELKTQAGLVLASSTGKYLPLKETEAVGMAADFVNDLNWLLNSARQQENGVTGLGHKPA